MDAWFFKKQTTFSRQPPTGSVLWRPQSTFLLSKSHLKQYLRLKPSHRKLNGPKWSKKVHRVLIPPKLKPKLLQNYRMHLFHQLVTRHFPSWKHILDCQMFCFVHRNGNLLGWNCIILWFLFILKRGYFKTSVRIFPIKVWINSFLVVELTIILFWDKLLAWNTFWTKLPKSTEGVDSPRKSNLFWNTNCCILSVKVSTNFFLFVKITKLSNFVFGFFQRKADCLKLPKIECSYDCGWS